MFSVPLNNERHTASHHNKAWVGMGRPSSLLAQPRCSCASLMSVFCDHYAPALPHHATPRHTLGCASARTPPHTATSA
ncbi:hypothetical protein BS50DRAFT_288389 [Corynespora cassiicola Philippines]|uniref:Uncharacterized protein n=1 Tax=Corynespora cassiicola Philippines TaxID=1448308 RepID=A0A2T2N0T9_CORCC|nr:hypothetical protein BS50DRAFT_288389 [Corynespora cassiicola Philippines]